MKLIVFLSVLVISYAKQGCEISIDHKEGDLKEFQPLILNGSYQIIYPDQKGILQFSSGVPILLACPGKNNLFNGPLKSDQIIKATCVAGKIFSVNKKSYEFNSFTCEDSSKSIVKKSGTCLGNFSQIELGFEFPETFVPIIEICRDNATQETYYSKMTMTKSVGGSQHNSPRPGWVSQNLFKAHHNINNLYTKHSQEEVLGKILNSEKLANKYLQKNSLARGHLAPKADFVYGSEQNTTFSYANAAPQWTTFNGGNWKYIETAVRKFVIDNDLQVTIYTGIHGQMNLRDENNEEHPVFLDIDENNNGYIRVPQFYWKIVYDPVHYLAFAVVGVNDPFRDEITKDMYLCPDISDSPKAAWLTKSWDDRKIISKGVSYVCLYEELKKAVPTVPDLKVKGILRNYQN